MTKQIKSPETGAGVAAVDRALKIVAAIESEAEPLSLAQIATATGFYKSTILRLIESLEAAHYVTRVQDGRFGLGVMAFRLGLAYERANMLRQHVLPALQKLVAAGSESASFHVRQDASRRLCLFRVDSNHSTLDRVRAGDVLPLNRGAAGRILLAFSGEPGAKHDEARRSYFALSLGERDPECAGMAVPVFGVGGALKGALSLSGAADRFTDAMVTGYRPKLLRAASDLTRLLGGEYSGPLRRAS